MGDGRDLLPARTRVISDAVDVVYAVGDVHGRADLLAPLLASIAERARSRRTAVVFLGDLADRGPQTREVFDTVVAVLRKWPDSVFCLGNHDDWFLRFLADEDLTEEELDLWLDQGGAQTLHSYGVERGTVAEIRCRIRTTHPSHVELLSNAAHLAFWNAFAFVHAGVDPSVPLARQARRACLWMRAPFLNHVGSLERIVVHGHSPQKPPRPHVTENRISLDTGAFFSGVLTAMEVNACEQTVRFFSTSRFGTTGQAEPVMLDRGHSTALRPTPEPRTYQPAKKGATRGSPNLAGVSGHEKPDT